MSLRRKRKRRRRQARWHDLQAAKCDLEVSLANDWLSMLHWESPVRPKMRDRRAFFAIEAMTHRETARRLRSL